MIDCVVYECFGDVYEFVFDVVELCVECYLCVL